MRLRRPLRGASAESAQIGSNDPLAAVIETISEGFALYGPDRRLMVCNSLYRQTYSSIAATLAPGAKLEELLHAGLDTGFVRHGFESDEEYIRARLVPDDVDSSGIEIGCADGCWLLVRTRRTAEGCLAVVQTDITELKRRQTKLADSDARFRDFAEMSSDWLWETDADLRFTKIGGAIFEHEGLDPSSVIGKTRLEVATDPDSPELIQHMEDMAAHRPFDGFVYTRTGVDGKTRRLRLCGRPAYDKDGAFVGYRGTGTDITRQHEAEQRATAALAQLMGALESISEGIALFDADDRLVVCNERYQWTDEKTAHLIVPGANWEEIVKARLESGLLVHDFESNEAFLRHRKARHRNFEEPIEQQFRGGRWALLREYLTADGGFALVLTDITELKQREAALSEARDAAEQAAQMRSAFVANMSHELRTPLNSIIGFSDVMRKESFGPLGSERYLEYANGIRESGQHLLAMINDILDLSKAEAGKLKLREQPVELCVLVADALRVMAERAEAAQITLHNETPGTLTPMTADGRKILQILLNLLSNAIKFTPAKGRVAISAGRDPSGDFFVHVADTGIGMSPEDIEVALSAFGQVDNQRNRHRQGTGLGLSLSRQLALLHGGHLEVESAPGQGTTVTLLLPATRAIDSI